MDPSVLLLAMGSFLGGLLVASRVTAWVTGLVISFKEPNASGRKLSFPLVIAQLLLHSGPWSLAIAIGAIYYVASLSQSVWLWAVLSGLGLATALLSAAVTLVHLRKRRHAAPVPLTPERLAVIRRRFYWGTSLYFGGSSAAFLLYSMWSEFSGSIFLVIMVLVICLGSGYGFSWFMWQWYGAALHAREKARLRAERENAV